MDTKLQSLINRINIMRHSGKDVEYLQVLRILQASLGENFLARVDIICRPSVSLSSSHTEVSDLFVDEKKVFCILNLMGLYGAKSPLPLYISDLISSQYAEVNILQDLLDIIHKRLYLLLYLAWEKSHPTISTPIQKQGYYQLMRQLYGCDNDNIIAAMSSFYYRWRNGAGLVALVRSLLPCQVNIIPWQPRWLVPDNIDAIHGATLSLKLGDNTLLGKRLFTRCHKISLKIGPIDEALYLKILPGTCFGATLIKAIRQYLGKTIDFDLLLQLRAATVQARLLSAHHELLGIQMLALGTAGEQQCTVTVPCARYYI